MSSSTRVLVVDADPARSAPLLELLAAAGYEAQRVAGVAPGAALPALAAADVVLASFDGESLAGLTRLGIAAPSAELVVLTCAAREADAREALRFGAADVVVRERGSEALLVAVERAARDAGRRAELALLRARLGEQTGYALVGRSAPMAALRELIGRAAAGRMTVLVTGEAGTGKDTVARLVHDLSDRAQRPFVVVRGEEIAAEPLAAELFGDDREGLLERARGGTLVIEEPRRLPRAVHDRLALTLSERSVTRRAGDQPLIDVRVILTERTPSHPKRTDAPELLGEHNVLPISLPPLRDRRSDIPALVKHFRDRIGGDTDIRLAPLAPEEIAPLLGHEWPGNVRELQHWVERMAYAAPASGMSPSSGVSPGSEFAPFDRLSLVDLERRFILHVLAQEHGHQSHTAARLGIDRRTLYRKLKEYRDDDATT